ncbi:MAG: protein phosphatase 2C domain-containing protein [Blastocatellia bacterium]|nr:protein phosphatase 2C domain-containing protein [Blastocatellia bacterium]
MWKYGFASVTGTSHSQFSLVCQDSSRVEVINTPQEEEILLAVASDGAGGAARANLGAELACNMLVAEVKTHFLAGGSWAQLRDDFISGWIGRFQALVMKWSGESPRDFACTLLAAIIGRSHAVYFQIGDGAIVASRGDDEYQCVCWPQRGEYANSTNFLTDDDAADKLYRECKTSRIDEVALFTDGIQNLVLDYRTRSAHSPYFASMFAWLRHRRLGSRELSDSLVDYLNSAKVNARTDDDKTLILATRR